MTPKERNQHIALFKDPIDGYFHQITHDEPRYVRKAWQALSILVGSNGDAAAALCKALTSPYFQTIKDALVSDDKDTIDAARDVHAALQSAYKRQTKFSPDKGLSLEEYAEKNTFRAVKDRQDRLEREKRKAKLVDKPKKRAPASVVPIKLKSGPK